MKPHYKYCAIFPFLPEILQFTRTLKALVKSTPAPPFIKEKWSHLQPNNYSWWKLAKMFFFDFWSHAWSIIVTIYGAVLTVPLQREFWMAWRPQSSSPPPHNPLSMKWFAYLHLLPRKVYGGRIKQAELTVFYHLVSYICRYFYFSLWIKYRLKLMLTKVTIKKFYKKVLTWVILSTPRPIALSQSVDGLGPKPNHVKQHFWLAKSRWNFRFLHFWPVWAYLNELLSGTNYLRRQYIAIIMWVWWYHSFEFCLLHE